MDDNEASMIAYNLLIDEALAIPAHYELDAPGDVLELMEDCMTMDEYAGFLRGNILKYAIRLGKKDTALSNARKILNYAAHLVCALEECGGDENERP